MQLTDADIEWSKDRTIELMQDGIPFAEAVHQASEECMARIIAREVRAIQRFEDESRRHHRARMKAQEDEASKLRAALRARATPGQRPTLTTSLGDLLRTKGGPR